MKKKTLLLGLTILSTLGCGVLYYFQNQKTTPTPQKLQSVAQMPQKTQDVLRQALSELRVAQRDMTNILMELGSSKELQGEDLNRFGTLIAQGTEDDLLKISLLPHPSEASKKNPYHFQLKMPAAFNPPEITKSVTLRKDGPCEIWLKDKALIYADLLHMDEYNIVVQTEHDSYKFMNRISPETHQATLYVYHNGKRDVYANGPIQSERQKKISKELDNLYHSLEKM